MTPPANLHPMLCSRPPWEDYWPEHDWIKYQFSPHVKAWDQIDYVLLDQHGGNPRSLPEDIKAALSLSHQDELLLAEELRKRQDVGAPELISLLLNRQRRGMAIHALVPRGLVDLNRRVVADEEYRDASYFLYDLFCWLDQRKAQTLDSVKTDYHRRDEFQKTVKWARNYYNAFRGSWQTPPVSDRLGAIELVHTHLSANAIFWDFHTLDPIGEDGRRRAVLQTFSSFHSNAYGMTPTKGIHEGHNPVLEELIPKSLSERMRSLLSYHPYICRLEPDESLRFAIDEPYYMFPGCTPEQTARRRATIVTDIRKDALPNWSRTHNKWLSVSQWQRWSALVDILCDILEIAEEYYRSNVDCR